MVKKKRETTPAIAISVGKAIARRRKSIGKTQRMLAEDLETGVETISRLESGVILQTVDRLQQLSKALDCPITTFFISAEDEPDIQTAAVADMLRSLPIEKRQKTIHLIGELVAVLRE